MGIDKTIISRKLQMIEVAQVTNIVFSYIKLLFLILNHNINLKFWKGFILEN